MRYAGTESNADGKRTDEHAGKEPVEFSVVICTYNRADLLGPAMRSVRDQDFTGQYELIVVDNNCTDSTSEVVKELGESWPDAGLTYIVEREQGLSAARNAGAKAAGGKVVAFIDDDSEADPGWLRNLHDVYEEFPDAASVGGKILPHWIGEKPEWFNGDVENICTLDRGDRVKEFVFPEHPFGGNLSIKRNIMLDLGGFSRSLGRKNKGLLSNEEKEFYYRLSQRPEYTALYAPGAVVHHKAFADKLTKRFVLRRFYWQGVSESVFEQITNPRSGGVLLASGLKRGGNLFPLAWRLCMGRISPKRSAHFNEFITLSQEIGMCKTEITSALGRMLAK